MRARRALLCFFFACALCLSGGATAAAAEADEKPVQAFGEDHPACREWTDGCIVCKKQTDGAVACSMVGTACLPAAAVCTRSAD